MHCGAIRGPSGREVCFQLPSCSRLDRPPALDLPTEIVLALSVKIEKSIHPDQAIVLAVLAGGVAIVFWEQLVGTAVFIGESDRLNAYLNTRLFECRPFVCCPPYYCP
jgi:hypothetical protein